jgi:protoporphyrinogen/coproporphyrinogen III oxidase
VNRYQQAMPQYPVGYLSLLKTIDEGGFAMRNVVLTGNWRRGVGIPDCIENGEQSADSLINSLCRI